MKYIKKYEHLTVEFEDKIIYGEYIKDYLNLLSGVDDYIDFNYYTHENHPNESKYVFSFNGGADLTKITNYLSENKIQYNIHFYNKNNTGVMDVSFYIKNETIKKYIELLNNVDKYNL